MSADKMQHQRYELKYLIDEEKALRVRDYVQSHLEIDEYGIGKPNLSYPVHSLYLDTGGLETYWNTINGDKNRYKLRVRYYDDRPTTPVFFEIKRRLNDIIIKERGGVRREAVRWMLAGQMPDQRMLLSPDAESIAALQRFIELQSHLGAVPRLHIAYLREAYENPADNNVRVTLDRQVLSAPSRSGQLPVASEHPHTVFGRRVILELKFTNRFPNWFRELVETFDCVLGGAAKYAQGIFDQGEDWATRPLNLKSPDELTAEFLAGTGAAANVSAFTRTTVS